MPSSLGLWALANEDVGQAVDETLPSPPRFRRPCMMANSQLALSSDCRTQMLIYGRHHFDMHLIHVSLVSQSSCQERKWATSAHTQGWVLALCWEYASLAPKVLVSRENVGSVPLEKGRRPLEMGRLAAEVGGREGWKHLERVGDLPGYRNGRHGNLRSHQKGHMNVYYIEKRKRKTMFPKPYSQGLRKKELECQRKAMLCVFITGPRVYVHICIWRYVHGLCCCGRFSITCKQHCWKDGVQSCWEAGEAGALLCSCGALREPAPKPPCQA